MAKHKTKKEWITLFKDYERNYDIPNRFFDALALKDPNDSKTLEIRNSTLRSKMTGARCRFKIKYKQWLLLDNKFMENKKEARGRKNMT